jgi:hypothetical protein
MHDIDRTLTEFEPETDMFEYPDELEGSIYTETGSPFDEVEEMELADELLQITNEAELDQFLGKLFKKVGRTVGRVVKSPIGGMLKGLAKKALPFVGGALGSFIPVPGVGTAVGTALGSAVGNALETELEGMDPEDREYEMARRFVRVAGTAVQQAALAQPGANPPAAAKTAVVAAARQHVPGLAGTTAASPAATMAGGKSRSGRWIRRGSKIILLGV